MSASISFLGRLGRDPETKSVNNSTVTKLAVAVDSGFGEKRTTAWFACDVWGKPGEAAKERLNKGSQVWISGSLSTREHNGKTILEVRVTDWQAPSEPKQAGGGYTQQVPSRAFAGDDVPF